MSGTVLTASTGFCSNLYWPAPQPSAPTATSAVCCFRATLSWSGVITRAVASASWSAMPCCLARATARSNDVCLIAPEAICAAPIVSALRFDWAKRTIPCWKVITRFVESCVMVRTPEALLRKSSTKSAAADLLDSSPSIAGAPGCAPVSLARVARSAAGSNGLAKNAAGLTRAANSCGSCL